jgi:hypothetical protein
VYTERKTNLKICNYAEGVLKTFFCGKNLSFFFFPKWQLSSPTSENLNVKHLTLAHS